MLSTYKLRHRLNKQKLSPSRQVLAMFGHLGCGFGQAAGTFGALAFGLVHPLATVHGIVAAGIKHQVVVGITAVVTGADKLRYKGNPVGLLDCS